MRTYRLLALAALLLSPSGVISAAAAEDVERGRMLYENHCVSCHESVVHVRDDHKAKSLGEVNWQIARWATERRLEWRYDEVRDVSRYLNARFYQFPKPVECE